MQDTAGTWLMTMLTPSPLLIALMQSAASLTALLLGLPAESARISSTVEGCLFFGSHGRVPPPSLRIPISGTDASYLHQSQINIPLSLPAAASVTVVVVSSGAGAAAVTPSSLSTYWSVIVTLSGTQNSQVAGDMKLEVLSNSAVLATRPPSLKEAIR